MNTKIPLNATLIILMIALGACANQPDGAETEKSNGASEEIGLPEYHQIPALKREALAGSTRAAMQLSLWYMKFPRGRDNDYYWTQIAAENGSAAGQFNLAQKLLSEPSDPLNVVRARFWLARSSKQGALRAKVVLAELDSAEKR